MKQEAMLLATVLALVSCASSGPNLTREERLQLYGHNSTPVASFRVDTRSGRVTRWSSLGDQALTVFGTSNQTYLLELQSRCAGLTSSHSISISNSFGTVTPGFDSVQLLGPGLNATTPSCRIGSARRIDRSSLNEAKAEIREAQLVERDPNVTAESIPPGQ